MIKDNRFIVDSDNEEINEEEILTSMCDMKIRVEYKVKEIKRPIFIWESMIEFETRKAQNMPILRRPTKKEIKASKSTKESWVQTSKWYPPKSNLEIPTEVEDESGDRAECKLIKVNMVNLMF